MKLEPPPARPAADLLTLTQWLSPAFPIGAFAYSHGLEWAIAAGEVHDAHSLNGWIAAALRHGAGRNDAILATHALRGHDAGELADLAEALAPAAERLAEVRAQGAAFCRAVNAVTGRQLPDMALPVALGVAAREMAVPAPTVIALMLQAFAGNLVTIGVRFVPLGQTAGQGVLAALHPAITDLAAEAQETGLEALGGAFFRGDMAAAWHETQQTRMFRT